MYVQRRKYLKGMLIFIVADIWNCYNMDMKKATNLNFLLFFEVLFIIIDNVNIE